MITPEAGSAEFPARLVGGRTAAASLRSGSIVTFRTTLSSLTGRLEFVGSEMRLAPVSTVDIPAGKTVRLMVVSTTPQLRLKLLPDSLPPTISSDPVSTPVARVLSALGLHRGVGAEEIVRALLNSHRELSPDLIRRLSARIGKELSQRWRQRRGRVMVEIVDREIDANEDDDSIESLLSSLTDGRWTSGERGEQRRSGQGSANQQTHVSLRSFLSRATSTPTHPLQLFNHLNSSGDLHWVVIPIGAQRDHFATSGTLRVGIDRTDQSPREATLALSVGSGVWWFSWKIEKDGLHLTSYEADESAPSVPESLLARISGRGHTNIDESQNGDGFSGTSSEVNKLGVDEYG